MGYKEKVLRKRLFIQSLATLQKFACSEPKLSMDKCCAIIAAIQLGGSLNHPHKQTALKKYYHLNYQYTQKGLLRPCLDKLVSCSKNEQKEVRKAICTLSSLSVWANTYPNITNVYFNSFAGKMLNDDSLSDPVPKAEEHLKQKFGPESILDLVTCSSRNFYKKYKEM